MTLFNTARQGLQVIGAGLPRTGTRSLKYMLEHLLHGPCYHMSELHARAELDMPKLAAALRGDFDQLLDVLDPWVAAVDWPAALFWRELADRFPEAHVVLSHRGSADTWWESADITLWQVMRAIEAGSHAEFVPGFHALMRERAGFDGDLDGEAARARYDAHFADVVATVPADRLIVWKPSEGWSPLCEKLGLPVPDIALSHANTTAEFGERFNIESV
ncbi:MAG: sulfotransferase family protein [Pseudomonadota bacterium]